MPRSPTIEETMKNLSKIEKVLQIGKVSEWYNFLYITLFLYPIIIIMALFYIKPRFIHKKDIYDNTQENIENIENIEICYRNLALWFIIFQLPIVLYFLINTCK